MSKSREIVTRDATLLGQDLENRYEVEFKKIPGYFGSTIGIKDDQTFFVILGIDQTSNPENTGAPTTVELILDGSPFSLKVEVQANIQYAHD